MAYLRSQVGFWETAAFGGLNSVSEREGDWKHANRDASQDDSVNDAYSFLASVAVRILIVSVPDSSGPIST